MTAQRPWYRPKKANSGSLQLPDLTFHHTYFNQQLRSFPAESRVAFFPNKDKIALFHPPYKLRWISWPEHQENRFQSQPKTSFAPIPNRHYSLSLSTVAFDHHYSLTTVLSTTISTTSNHLTTSRGGYTTSPSPFYSFFLFFFFLSPTPPQGTSPSTALCQTSDDSRDP